MSRDLYRKLGDPEVLKIAANYVHDDKKDDFIPDVFRNQDYIFNLQDNLQRLGLSLRNGTYRPRQLKEIDVPKSGLAVRPGSTLDIEDHVVLFAIAYLLAPVLDRFLPENVFHFRVRKKGRHPHPEKLFQSDGPILVHKAIRRKARIFENWYEAWPEYVVEAQSIYEKQGFTFMVESDISAYFENISHPLLADILRQHAPQQLHLINLLMEMLAIWATPSLTGFKPQRGIPQGNEVSSWLGTLYLIQMDTELLKLQRRGLIKYVRYVDDTKIFTKGLKTARAIVFRMNRILRYLHLNIQSSKTDIFEGEEVRDRLFDTRVEQVSEIIDSLPKLPAKITPEKRGQVEKAVRPLFKKTLAYKRKVDKEDLRLIKRILTLLSYIRSPMAVKQSLKWIWKQPVLTEKLARYLSLWMARRSVQNEVKKALLGEEELFETQYLYLLPMLRCSKVLAPMHKSGLMRLGRDQSHHPAVRAEALISLILFPLKDKDFGRIKRQYQKETSPLVKKTILALFLKARDQIKRPMFAETILDPEEEINRYRKYIWALMNSPRHCQPVLKILKTIEKDPSRLLATLHGALQSHNIETLKQVKAIARNRTKSLVSEIARQAYKRVADDAGFMIEDKTRAKDKK